MQTVIETFESRAHEIQVYFKWVECVDLNFQNKKQGITTPESDEVIKILKANVLMMLYNLVEATILGGILVIYDKLKKDGCTYIAVSDEIQKIWFSFKFRQVYDGQANYESYKGKAVEIVKAILNKEVIDLDRKATAISGNLDADKIRLICNNHGIRIKSDSKNKGGCILSRVKNDRNNLSHGVISFAECGRDLSINDLRDMINQTNSFLGDVLSSFKDYYNNKLYLKSSTGC